MPIPGEKDKLSLPGPGMYNQGSEPAKGYSIGKSKRELAELGSDSRQFGETVDLDKYKTSTVKVSIGGGPKILDESKNRNKVGPGSYDYKFGTIEGELPHKGATIKRRYRDQNNTITPGPGYYSGVNSSPTNKGHSIPRAETVHHRKSHDQLPGPGSYRPSPTLQAA